MSRDRELPHDPIWPVPRRVEIARGIVAKTAANLDQVGFRFRNDDGSESGASWRQAENTDDTIEPGTTFRLRFVIDDTNAGGENNATFQLQVQLNGGGYQDVTGTSSIVQAVASPNFADEDATTRQLTSGAGTFLTGAMSEDGTAGGNNQIDFTDGTDEVTELEFALQIIGADVSTNDTLDFRVVRSGGTLLEAYTQDNATATVAGTVVSESLTETAEASDAAAAAATVPVSLAESAAASDAVSGGLVASESLTEVAEAADAVAVARVAVSLVESAQTADSLSVVATSRVSLSESATTVEATAATATSRTPITESADSAETTVAGKLVSESVVEVASAADSVAAVAIARVSEVEPAQAGDFANASALGQSVFVIKGVNWPGA